PRFSHSPSGETTENTSTPAVRQIAATELEVPKSMPMDLLTAPPPPAARRPPPPPLPRGRPPEPSTLPAPCASGRCQAVAGCCSPHRSTPAPTPPVVDPRPRSR